MRDPVLTTYTVTTEYPMDAPIRIAHVSDLHERRAFDILDLLRASKPDLIVVTGDTLERYDDRPQYQFERRPVKRAIIVAIHYTNYFLRRFESEAKKANTENAYAFLREAAKLAPVYMSLGNHEQSLLSADYDFYRENGITLLDNASAVTSVKGMTMHIGGMSSWDFEEFLPRFAEENGFKLLLCHHPERFEPYIKDTSVDLTLSGHTHGGQVRVGRKGRGFFVPGQGIGGRLAHGYFFGGRLIVSSGCANTVACPRIANPRELVIVELKNPDAERK
jgi:hypothetical protein